MGRKHFTHQFKVDASGIPVADASLVIGPLPPGYASFLKKPPCFCFHKGSGPAGNDLLYCLQGEIFKLLEVQRSLS